MRQLLRKAGPDVCIAWLEYESQRAIKHTLGKNSATYNEYLMHLDL
jgi:hypothetical protein